MKRTYQKIALAKIEAGEEMEYEYCPCLIEGPFSKSLSENGFQQVGVATVTVTFDSPESIRTAQMATLKEQLQATRADNQRRENAILDQISKLQALTFVEAS